MKKHKIQWLNIPGYKGETWNPIIGCSKVSDGCKNCYAEKMANRIAHIQSTSHYLDVLESSWDEVKNKLQTEGWNGFTFLQKNHLSKPSHWKKPRVVFVCSMGDLFHEDTDPLTIGKVFEVMERCPQHLFIVLTKRAKNMADYMNAEYGNDAPPKNVWFGVTAENQETANERMPYLFDMPAAVRFVSVEPMLGPINLKQVGFLKFKNWLQNNTTQYGLDWVICGGESGPQARPMHPDWVRSLRDRCRDAGVPFFFKQWGEYEPVDVSREDIVPFKQTNNPYTLWKNKDGDVFELIFEEGDFLICGDSDSNYYVAVKKVGKKAAGNLLDGERIEEYPELPPVAGAPCPPKNRGTVGAGEYDGSEEINL